MLYGMTGKFNGVEEEHGPSYKRLYSNLHCLRLGLGDLVQEQDFLSNDGRAVLRYRCRLCTVQMELYEMATHVVGRRHRQKYLVRLRLFFSHGWGKPCPEKHRIRISKYFFM